jgi:hypothetical protein
MKGGGVIRIPISGVFFDEKTVKLPNPEDNLLFIDIPIDRTHKRTIHNIRRRLRKIIVEDLVNGYSYLSKKDISIIPENMVIYISPTSQPHRIIMDISDTEIPDNDSIYDLNAESKIEVIIIESAISAFEFAENKVKYNLNNKQNQLTDEPHPTALPTSFFNTLDVEDTIEDPHIVSGNSTF